MDMPVFFASIDEKNQISIHTTYSGIKSNNLSTNRQIIRTRSKTELLLIQN